MDWQNDWFQDMPIILHLSSPNLEGWQLLILLSLKQINMLNKNMKSVMSFFLSSQDLFKCKHRPARAVRAPCQLCLVYAVRIFTQSSKALWFKISLPFSTYQFQTLKPLSAESRNCTKFDSGALRLLPNHSESAQRWLWLSLLWNWYGSTRELPCHCSVVEQTLLGTYSRFIQVSHLKLQLLWNCSDRNLGWLMVIKVNQLGSMK